MMKEFYWADMPKQTAFPIASAGYPYILASAFFTIVFAMMGMVWLAILGMLAVFFICYFFRDPDRITPLQNNAVISPADGKIVFAGMVNANPFIPGQCYKIGIFMSIFNVHVNRAPFSGTVKNIIYRPGKFFSANKDVASLQNEHNAIVLETEKHQILCFVQIAGLIARRIICGVREGDNVVCGQRYGLICFGSRVDIYLPPDFQPQIAKGDKVFGGSSVLGFLGSTYKK